MFFTSLQLIESDWHKACEYWTRSKSPRAREVRWGEGSGACLQESQGESHRSEWSDTRVVLYSGVSTRQPYYSYCRPSFLLRTDTDTYMIVTPTGQLRLVHLWPTTQHMTAYTTTLASCPSMFIRHTLMVESSRACENFFWRWVCLQKHKYNDIHTGCHKNV